MSQLGGQPLTQVPCNKDGSFSFDSIYYKCRRCDWMISDAFRCHAWRIPGSCGASCMGSPRSCGRHPCPSRVGVCRSGIDLYCPGFASERTFQTCIIDVMCNLGFGLTGRVVWKGQPLQGISIQLLRSSRPVLLSSLLASHFFGSRCRRKYG